MNRCEDLGLLVGAKGQIPSDPHDYGNAWSRRTGCSHLVCAACGAAVESFAGWSWNVAHAAVFDEVIAADIGAATGAPEAAGGALVASETGRLYRCRCTIHIEEGESPITRYRDSGTSAVGAIWSCGGHPPMRLPAVIEGIAVDARTGNARNWVLAAIDGARGGGKDLRMAARRRLATLWFALAGSEVEPQLTMAVAALVNDAEQHRRDLALHLYMLAPWAMGSERVGIWLAEKPEWFASSPDFDNRRSVALNVARRSVEAGRPYEPPTQALLRKEALTPESAGDLLPFMARFDRDWFVAHAHELPRSQFDDVRRLLPYVVAPAEQRAIEERLAAAASG